MLVAALRGIRIGLRLAWLAGIAVVVTLAAGPAALRIVGIDTYSVRGGSMSPTVPLGAVVLVQHVSPSAIAAGDVITFRAANDTVVTHRVLGRSDGDDPTFITKGDANDTQDPEMVPGAAVIGRLVLTIPLVGWALADLGTSTGVLVVAAGLACLMVAGWFIDELRATVAVAGRDGPATELAG